jgi:hypothetical protein
MKTLRINISKEISIANLAWTKQKKHIEAQRPLIKQLLAVALLFLTITVSAQKFSDINGIGKSLIELEPITNHFMFYSTGQFEDLRIDNYFSTDYGVIGYAFNKKDICVKILIPTDSKRIFDFDKFYLTRQIAKTNITVVTLL